MARRMLEANVHTKVVQEILGHANIAMTLDTYSHVFPNVSKFATDKIAFLFEEDKVEPEEDGK